MGKSLDLCTCASAARIPYMGVRRFVSKMDVSVVNITMENTRPDIEEVQK
jgi:hypothetical protein